MSVCDSTADVCLFEANSEMTVMNGLLNAHISSPIGQPFSFPGAPPDEVLWVGDQLHISISARISGRREGLSLTERVENGGKVEQCCPVWLHLPPCPAVVSHLSPVCIHVSHQFLGQC